MCIDSQAGVKARKRTVAGSQLLRFVRAQRDYGKRTAAAWPRKQPTRREHGVVYGVYEDGRLIHRRLLGDVRRGGADWAGVGPCVQATTIQPAARFRPHACSARSACCARTSPTPGPCAAPPACRRASGPRSPASQSRSRQTGGRPPSCSAQQGTSSRGRGSRAPATG